MIGVGQSSTARPKARRPLRSRRAFCSSRWRSSGSAEHDFQCLGGRPRRGRHRGAGPFVIMRRLPHAIQQGQTAGQNAAEAANGLAQRAANIEAQSVPGRVGVDVVAPQPQMLQRAAAVAADRAQYHGRRRPVASRCHSHAGPRHTDRSGPPRRSWRKRHRSAPAAFGLGPRAGGVSAAGHPHRGGGSVRPAGPGDGRLRPGRSGPTHRPAPCRHAPPRPESECDCRNSPRRNKTPPRCRRTRLPGVPLPKSAGCCHSPSGWWRYERRSGGGPCSRRRITSAWPARPR